MSTDGETWIVCLASVSGGISLRAGETGFDGREGNVREIRSGYLRAIRGGTGETEATTSSPAPDLAAIGRSWDRDD